MKTTKPALVLDPPATYTMFCSTANIIVAVIALPSTTHWTKLAIGFAASSAAVNPIQAPTQASPNRDAATVTVHPTTAANAYKM